MGLLHEQAGLPLRADYSPVTIPGWVFLQVAAWHIITTGSLEMLAQVDGTSKMGIPSWVPDWTRRSPTSLPAQLEVSEGATEPSIRSKDGLLLRPTATLNYPLGCGLRVTGRRCGTVWTDTRIFGKALAHTTTIESYLVDYRGKVVLHIIYPTIYGGHWLHQPSQSPGTWRCDSRLDFWRRILFTYHATNRSPGYPQNFEVLPADIPPSFGGFCWNCIERDRLYGELIRMAAEVPGSSSTCLCKSPLPSASHFDKQELEDFIAKWSQYGTNRRIFATDHSLGFGPTEVEDWDEVWMLEGATTPFVLRRVSGRYKLIGACYVHAASRPTDRCCICKHGTTRERITVASNPDSRLGMTSEELGTVLWDDPPKTSREPTIKEDELLNEELASLSREIEIR